jgi:hypothetical protein
MAFGGDGYFPFAFQLVIFYKSNGAIISHRLSLKIPGTHFPFL